MISSHNGLLVTRSSLCVQAEVQLNLATPFLPYLKDLRLVDLNLASFPDALALRLCRLVALDLSCNQFESLPPSIATITSLKVLDVSQNFVQLRGSDVPLLASFTGLRRLAVLSQRTRESSRSGLSLDSFRYLQAFSKRCPGVDLL